MAKKNEDVELIRSMPEFKLITPLIEFPLTVGDVRFTENNEMLKTEFYSPTPETYRFIFDSTNDPYRRAGNVIATCNPQHHMRSEYVGTLYISKYGAYCLVTERGLVPMSGSRFSIGFRNENRLRQFESQRESRPTPIRINVQKDPIAVVTLAEGVVINKNKIIEVVQPKKRSRFEDLIS